MGNVASRRIGRRRAKIVASRSIGHQLSTIILHGRQPHFANRPNNEASHNEERPVIDFHRALLSNSCL